MENECHKKHVFGQSAVVTVRTSHLYTMGNGCKLLQNRRVKTVGPDPLIHRFNDNTLAELCDANQAY